MRADVPVSAETVSICGIMGTIRLLAGTVLSFAFNSVRILISSFLKSKGKTASVFLGMYLVVITKKTKVGDLLGHTVWKAVDFDIISYKKTILHLNDDQVGLHFEIFVTSS